MVIKTYSNGNIQWDSTYGGNSYNQSECIRQTTDGGYVIVGSEEVIGSGDDNIYLMKIDGNGNQEWDRTYGGTYHESGHHVEITNDGGYVISGWKSTNSPGSQDIWVIKTDSLGYQVWDYTFGNVGTNDVGYCIHQTGDFGYVITGYAGGDMFLLKIDLNGIQEWNQVYTTGGSMSDGGYYVRQTSDGGFIISGYTEHYLIVTGDLDLWLVKTNPQGSITSQFTIPINPNRELNKVVDILGRDINPEKNQPFIEIYNDGTVEKKMIIE